MVYHQLVGAFIVLSLSICTIPFSLQRTIAFVPTLRAHPRLQIFPKRARVESPLSYPHINDYGIVQHFLALKRDVTLSDLGLALTWVFAM